MEGRLGSENVIITILSNELPFFLRHRLIPRKPKLLVMDSQLNLKLLKRLLLTREVINIRVRDVICLTEEALMIIDNGLRQIKQTLIVVSHHPSIQNMIVVLPTVEAYKLVPHESLDFLRSRINHSHARSFNAIVLPADDKQIREHLDIEERNLLVIVNIILLARLVRLKLHALHNLHALCCLIRTIQRKCLNSLTHVRYIVM